MAQSDGNYCTDGGLRPSVRNQKNMDSGTQKTLGVLHLKELNVTDGTI
jgi:hypothetical protein